MSHPSLPARFAGFRIRATRCLVAAIVLAAAACAPAAPPAPAPTAAPAAPPTTAPAATAAAPTVAVAAKLTDAPKPAPAATIATAPTASAAATTKRQGGTLTVDVGGDLRVDNLDQSFGGSIDGQVVNQIFEYLITLDRELKLAPALATSWKVSDDKLSWTIELRKGVTFHDGTPFNAEAVKYNVEQRWLDPQATATIAVNARRMIDRVEALDDSTVRFVTKTPETAFGNILTSSGSHMASPAALKALGTEFGLKPIGTGPFKVESFTPSVSLTLARNDAYWTDKPALDKVIFRVVREPAARTAALLSGQSDLSALVSPSQIPSLTAEPRLQITEQTATRQEWLVFDVRRPHISDPRVRQALSLAMDMEEVKQVAYDGYLLPAQGPLLPLLFKPDASVAGLTYNPDRARELLKQAGAEQLKLTFGYNETPEYNRRAQVIQGQLRRVGVELELMRMDLAALATARKESRADIYSSGFGNSAADVGLALVYFPYSKGSDNCCSYNNTKLDALTDQIRLEADGAKRAPLLNDLYREFFADPPAMAYQIPINVYAASSRVQGFNPHPQRERALNLAEVWLSE